MKFNQALERMSTYPFVQLEDAKRKVADRLGDLIDFGVGDPMERTPEFIRRALIESITENSSYPKAAGLPEAREAIADWCRRRFGVEVDAAAEVLPSSGSKEAIFGLAQIAVDRSADKSIVVTTEPGYPIPLRSAKLNGCHVLTLPLRENLGFLPDLDSIDDATWRRIALFWVNYPNNPTGATAPVSFYEELASRALEHDFLVASDEAYSEIYFGDPPHSALEVTDRGHVVVFNTLSKRSAMTGYRSGSIVADENVMTMFKRYRPIAGTASPEFIQRAAAAAWRDETHVEEMRSIYGAKRGVIEPFLRDKGLRVAGGSATFYLWVATPDGETEDAFALRLLQRGVVVAPGTFFGEAGRGYVRMALVPALEQCRKAVDLLDDII
ncbi:MAG: pyridoxal phosphate-dependent aminotransferase [Actinomycetota bacterium]